MELFLIELFLGEGQELAKLFMRDCETPKYRAFLNLAGKVGKGAHLPLSVWELSTVWLSENWWLWEHGQTTRWPTSDIHADSVLAPAAAGIGEEGCVWEMTFSWGCS